MSLKLWQDWLQNGVPLFFPGIDTWWGLHWCVVPGGVVVPRTVQPGLCDHSEVVLQVIRVQYLKKPGMVTVGIRDCRANRQKMHWVAIYAWFGYGHLVFLVVWQAIVHKQRPTSVIWYRVFAWELFFCLYFSVLAWVVFPWQSISVSGELSGPWQRLLFSL